MNSRARRRPREDLGVGFRSRLLIALVILGSIGIPATTVAGERLWDRIRAPRVVKTQKLILLADGVRLPADTSFGSGPLWLRLNERCAVMIELAGGGQLVDADLLQLYGDCLFEAGVQHFVEARKQLLRALAQAPQAPWAGAAWRAVALASGRLGDHAQEYQAYDQAIAEEWDPDLRAILFLNRAESSQNAGRVADAVHDYRAALAESTRSDTRALAEWGLAVALDRASDFPKAMPLANSASAVRFGRGGRLDALDLPGVFFVPGHELYYYRALALESSALAERSQSKQVELLQASQLMWLNYVQAAEGGRWVSRAMQHLKSIRHRLNQLIN